MTASEYLRNNPWLDERTFIALEFELREVLESADIDNKDRQKLKQQVRSGIGQFRAVARAANYARALENKRG